MGLKSREQDSSMIFLLTRQAFHRFISRQAILSYIRAMSLQSTILKLNSPIKELVLSVTRDGEELGGKTEADAREVIVWVDKATQADFVAENNIKVCFTRISDEIFFFDCHTLGPRHHSHSKNVCCHKLSDRRRRCGVRCPPSIRCMIPFTLTPFHLLTTIFIVQTPTF